MRRARFADQEQELASDQKLLIERFVSYYAKLPKKTVDNVKKEVKMTFVASTITEHIRHESEMIERARSEKRMKQFDARSERPRRDKAGTTRSG